MIAYLSTYEIITAGTSIFTASEKNIYYKGLFLFF